MGTDGGAQVRAGTPVAQIFFDAVEVLDLPDDPARRARARFEGFVELAPGVCRAAGERDSAAPAISKGGIGAVAVALQSAAKSTAMTLSRHVAARLVCQCTARKRSPPPAER